MPAPVSNTTVAALVVAAYAALVSTATAIVQLFNYRRDRSRIKVCAAYNMEIVGDPANARKGLTIINVMNIGRRPVTINSIGAWRLHPHNPIVIPETHPALPCEITEGRSVRAILPPCNLDLNTIECWEASDGTGHTYRQYIVPWTTRLMSSLKWRRQLQRDRKKRHSAKRTSAV